MSAAERSRKIWALAELIDANGEELAHLESLDNGKPVKLARYVDVAESSGQLRYFAGWPTKIEGNVIPISAPDTLCYTRPEPVACRRADPALELPAHDRRVEGGVRHWQPGAPL